MYIPVFIIIFELLLLPEKYRLTCWHITVVTLELSSLASSQNIPAFDPDESIPKLIETLKDDDPIVVDVSFKSLEGYSRSDKFKWAITTHK